VAAKANIAITVTKNFGRLGRIAILPLGGVVRRVSTAVAAAANFAPLNSTWWKNEKKVGPCRQNSRYQHLRNW
jgi:hypothetical protein